MVSRLLTQTLVALALAMSWSSFRPTPVRADAPFECYAHSVETVYAYPDEFRHFVFNEWGPGYASDQSTCNGWAQDQVLVVAGQLCRDQGLEGGQGYVIADWSFTWYDENGTAYGGSSSQQFDCGDV